MNVKRFLISALGLLAWLSPVAFATEAPPPKLTLISNVNVFDGKTDKLHERMHVLVKDNLIEAVSDEPLVIIQTDNVTMIDGGGRTLMPGLIDAHSHLAHTDVPLSVLLTADHNYITLVQGQAATKMLMRGFTAFRDVGTYGESQ